mmetsp:Transcript_11757/g.15342  ORF Transcript_11757/g.15342 Transcript_11757/m.15342 type:complete len:215 (-) Transcript_11757:112-756(-)
MGVRLSIRIPVLKRNIFIVHNLICRPSFSHNPLAKFEIISHKVLVFIRTPFSTRINLLEPPAIKLPKKTFKTRMLKILWKNFGKNLMILNSKRRSTIIPNQRFRIILIFQHFMQLKWKCTDFLHGAPRQWFLVILVFFQQVTFTFTSTFTSTCTRTRTSTPIRIGNFHIRMTCSFTFTCIRLSFVLLLSLNGSISLEGSRNNFTEALFLLLTHV